MSSFFSLLKWKEFVIFGFFVICMPFLIYVNVHFVYILLFNNHVSLIINNYILIILYKKINSINLMKYPLITRLGNKESVKTVHLFISIITLIFVGILYVFGAIVYGVEGTNLYLIGLLLLNTCVYLIEANVVCLQFNRKSNVLFIIIPIIINLCFHYIFFV